MAIKIKRTARTSPTARNLKEALNEDSLTPVKLLLTEGSTYVGNEKSLVINWGSSEPLRTGMRAKVLNSPSAIPNAANKIKSFELMAEEDVDIPWYVEKSDRQFIEKLAVKVYSNPTVTLFFRTTATGYGGSGIHILENVSDKTYERFDTTSLNAIKEYLEELKNTDYEWSSIIRNTKFVSEYFRAKDEFRVHVVCGQVIFCQRKALRTDEHRPENPDFHIRNHENGFIFQQNNIEVPEMVKESSIKAVKALGLDFGAVDIKFRRSRSQGDSCKVLEVNTAPGLSGNTLKAYKNVFTMAHNVLQE